MVLTAGVCTRCMSWVDCRFLLAWDLGFGAVGCGCRRWGVLTSCKPHGVCLEVTTSTGYVLPSDRNRKPAAAPKAPGGHAAEDGIQPFLASIWRFWRLCLGVDNMHSYLQTGKVLLGLVWLPWWFKVFEFRV